MFQVIVRADQVQIEGYVNAVDRFSKPIQDNRGSFIERILPKAFARALKRNKKVRVLLNHDPTRELANTADGTARLTEDSIGLRAKVTIKDPEVVQLAREKKLVGWSFGFRNPEQEFSTNSAGLSERTISNLTLDEVSILDNTRSPAYYGTMIEARDEDEDGAGIVERRSIVEPQAEYATIENEEGGESSGAGKQSAEGESQKRDEEKKPVDYTELEARINKVKEGEPTS